MVSHHLAMFGRASGDTKYLIFHVISKNHVTEGSCKFMSGMSLFYSTILPSLVAIGIVLVEMFLVCGLARPRD